MMSYSKPARHYTHRLFQQSWPVTGVVGSRFCCHSIARLLPSRLSMSNSACLIHANNTLLQQQRNSSSSSFLDSPNPVLKLAKLSQAHDVDFSKVTPRHVLDARNQIQSEFKELLSTGTDQNSLKLLEQFKTTTALTKYMKSRMETLETSSQSINRIASFLYHVNLSEPAWFNARQSSIQDHERLFNHKEEIIEDLVAQLIHENHEMFANDSGGAPLSNLNELNQNVQDDEHFVQNPPASKDTVEADDILTNNSRSFFNIEAMYELISAEKELMNELIPMTAQTHTTMASTEQLQIIDAYLAIKHKQAELCGYDSHVDLIMDGRVLRRKEIEALLLEVADRAQKARSLTCHMEEKEACVSKYISLEGTLQSVFALCRVLFGIIVCEDDNPKGWHADVRLFHLIDENNQKLGSFYLDPFERSTKTKMKMSGSLTPDVSYITVDIAPPLRGRGHAKMELNDIVAIFHEFGHVLQYIVADGDKRRGLVSTMANEFIEIVPHFMSQWVMNETMLQTLAHLSSETQIPKEIIMNVQEMNRQTWIERCLLHAYEGHLEFEMFSSRKADGAASNESLVAMERRILNRFLPHDTRPQSELHRLSYLIGDNVRGTSIASYRYLLSEVISAEIFILFNNADLSDEGEMRKLGTKFKKVLLEPGICVDLKQVFLEFFGRDSLSTARFFKLYKL